MIDRPRWRRLRGTWSKRVPRTDAFLSSHRARLLMRMHPLLRPLVRAAIAEEIPLSEVEERGGVGAETIRKWFGSDPSRKVPALGSLEAALGVFGMALAVVPADWLPDNDDRDLTTVEALRRMVRRAQDTERDPAADTMEEPEEPAAK
jgi:hypothetical protein